MSVEQERLTLEKLVCRITKNRNRIILQSLWE